MRLMSWTKNIALPSQMGEEMECCRWDGIGGDRRIEGGETGRERRMKRHKGVQPAVRDSMLKLAVWVWDDTSSGASSGGEDHVLRYLGALYLVTLLDRDRINNHRTEHVFLLFNYTHVSLTNSASLTLNSIKYLVVLEQHIFSITSTTQASTYIKRCEAQNQNSGLLAPVFFPWIAEGAQLSVTFWQRNCQYSPLSFSALFV